MPDEKQPFGCPPVSAFSTEQRAALERARQSRAAVQDVLASPWAKHQPRVDAMDATAVSAASPEASVQKSAALSTHKPAPTRSRFKPLEEYRFEDCLFYMGHFH